MISLLKPFQQFTEALNANSEPQIYQVWSVYNTVHKHLEEQIKEIAAQFSIKWLWTHQLVKEIKAVQEKLKIYYSKTSEDTETYFNIRILINACVKGDFYQVFMSLLNITKQKLTLSVLWLGTKWSQSVWDQLLRLLQSQIWVILDTWICDTSETC